jgi:hypothetical protein
MPETFTTTGGRNTLDVLSIAEFNSMSLTDPVDLTLRGKAVVLCKCKPRGYENFIALLGVLMSEAGGSTHSREGVLVNIAFITSDYVARQNDCITVPLKDVRYANHASYFPALADSLIVSRVTNKI